MRTAMACLMVGALGCEAVAGVDLKYQEAGPDTAGPLQMAKDGGLEGGDIVMAPGDPVGQDGFCGCDHAQGLGCCLLPGSGAPFCTDNASMNACAAKGGVFIGCERDDLTTDSLCCWRYGTGAGSVTSYASMCQGAHACSSTPECQGSTCQITTCKGIKVGACGVAPTCP